MTTAAGGSTRAAPSTREIQDAASRLRDLMGRLRRRMNAQLPPGSPSLSELSVLTHLHHVGPAAQVELASLQNVRPQSMGATVAAMEAAGLVRRSDDPSDRRKVVVSVTPAGRRHVERLLRSRQDWLAASMSTHLDAADQHTLIDAIGLLERLLER